MTKDELVALFEQHRDEYLNFDRVVVKRTLRPDLHAFLLLEAFTLEEGNRDVVSAAEHDEIFLSFNVDTVAASRITEDHVIDLIRCGVMYSKDHDCFCMFV